MPIAALIILAALSIVPVAASPAQSTAAVAATALRATHVAGLPPLMTPAMLGRQLNGAQLALRYGLRDESGVRTQSVAGSAVFSLGLRSSAALTAGVADGDCASCSPALMLGIGGDMRVYESSAGEGSSLKLAVSADLGYAQVKPGDGSAFAIGIGAPVVLDLASGGREGMHIVPYFTPVFGIGQYDATCPAGFDCSTSGSRLVLGGGIGLWNPMTSISAAIGINQVMISGAQPVYGISVSFGGR